MIYGKGKKAEEIEKYAREQISRINDALTLREQESPVFNGMTYSQHYEYNRRKALNYAPPKGKDDTQLSLGLPHEKIISFVSIFLKYAFKLEAKVYDNNGNEIDGLGDIYKLAIEHSRKLERLERKIGLVYWEMYTQGDAFVLEDWEVKTIPQVVAKKDGKMLSPEKMDYTYEFLENLSFEEKKEVQIRRAVTRLLDGRQVILANPELDDANGGLQAQPFVVIEEFLERDKAEQIYGSLNMWDKVPDAIKDINKITGRNLALFKQDRIEDAKKYVLVHRMWDKINNRFNIFINGVMMLPKDTPFTLFYPRGNYPIVQFSAERASGTAYSRSVPAKTKFNSDFVDWLINALAERLKRDIDPPLLVRGKYMLMHDIFKAGQRTHGITRDDYELALPDDKSLTNAHFSFLDLIKDIMESQTVNPTTSGEMTGNATATEIATVDQNQRDKLAYLLDAVVNGYIDLALRRAETIESKYTIKQRETVVDDKKVSVYQNFTVNINGINHRVEFTDEIDDPLYDVEKKRDELFEKAYKMRKQGKPTEFYLVNPRLLREQRYNLIFEIKPEKLKESALQLVQMKDEFNWLLSVFPNVNREKLQEEYLKITGRSEDLFIPQELQQIKNAEQAQQQNDGSFGQANIKQALQEEKLGYVR